MTKQKKSRKKNLPLGNKLPSNRKNGFLSNNKYIVLSFIVPFLLMTVAFAVYNVAPFGIFNTMYKAILFNIGKVFPGIGINVTPNFSKPWGDRQMLVIDLWHQYFPFLYDLHDKLQSGGSLFWTWSVGMGSNFIGMMSYYLLSPLNFLSVIIPSDWLVGYLAVATVIKISCAGMFTAICFKIIFKRHDLSLVFFSAMFALCSFNMGYYWCVIWLDSVAMLPLVVAGTVSLLRDGRYKLFIISLGLAVVFNYYIGLFICVAVFLTAVGYTASCWGGIRKALKDLLRTAICSVISLLMTAPITIPAYLVLQNCYKSASGMPTRFDINIGSDDAEGVFNAIVKIISNSISFLNPTDKEGLPNIACGLLCVLLLAVFFCCRKVKLGEKIFCSVTLLFLIASFIFRQLDYMWHGFHFPNMLPYRFSFLFSFLLIYMAYRAFMYLEDSSYIDVIIGALAFVLIILPSVFTVFNVLSEPLLDEDHVSLGAVIASICVAVVMLVLLFLYTNKKVNKRVISVLLCIVVIGELCATGIIGVGTVSTTTTSDYPRESKNVQRIVSHIDRWSEDDPDIFRTEVTSTQTLNDGALNSYNGVSVFNSMANVNITRFVEYFGCGGWPAGNRYTYYESSPVTNNILNLKYLIARDGVCRNTAYMKEVDTSGSVKLYENQAYLPQGFMVDSALESLVINSTSANPGTVENPIENQIEFWRLATGIEEPVYTQLEVKDQGHTDSSVLSVTKTSEGMYSAVPSDSTTPIHVKFNYYLEEDGLVVTYFKVNNASGDGNIYVNDENLSSLNVKCSYIKCVGEYKKGDKISLYSNIELGKTSSIRAFCYVLNKEVYEKGLEILGESTLKATSSSDTHLEGTVDVKKDGLLYTSIPYEKGWSVTVDGKKEDVVAIGNGVCAVRLTEGTHTVRFSFVPDGFVIGMTAFIFALAIFVFFCLMTRKKREKVGAVRKATLWLFDPTVKERKKKSDDSDVIDESESVSDAVSSPDAESSESGDTE